MASSLNRIFAKKIDPTFHRYENDESEESSTGSETESVPEEVDSAENTAASKRRTSGGAALAQTDAKEKMKLQRNPTRRPNPKISNRNALLARENRRRKKEHVELLEKEVDELREYNSRIQKSLKKKTKLVDQLTRERNYLKSVIANKTGILAILKSVQRAGLPMTSSGLTYVTESAKTPTTSSSDEGFGSSPHPMLTDEDEKFSQHDLGLAPEEVLFEEEFNRMPDVDELLSTMASSGSSSEQVIKTEHNYFEQSNHNSLESGPTGTAGGVCVHIVPGGRISVEFCASCALSSHYAWLEDAEER